MSVELAGQLAQQKANGQQQTFMAASTVTSAPAEPNAMRQLEEADDTEETPRMKSAVQFVSSRPRLGDELGDNPQEIDIEDDESGSGSEAEANTDEAKGMHGMSFFCLCPEYPP